jgi:hypothetical protein
VRAQRGESERGGGGGGGGGRLSFAPRAPAVWRVNRQSIGEKGERCVPAPLCSAAPEMNSRDPLREERANGRFSVSSSAWFTLERLSSDLSEFSRIGYASNRRDADSLKSPQSPDRKITLILEDAFRLASYISRHFQFSNLVKTLSSL